MLRRFTCAAACITAGMLDATTYFDGRLPAAFGGYERELTRYPVEYPTACSPQTWSTGIPLLLLRTLLGLEPMWDNLVEKPAMPMAIGHLQLLAGRWGRADAFGRGHVDVETRGGLRPHLGAVRETSPATLINPWG